jgi:hypothetical protein
MKERILFIVFLFVVGFFVSCNSNNTRPLSKLKVQNYK